MYKWAGVLIAVSLCNGGEAGNSLAECLYNLISIGEDACRPAINDVPDTEVRTTLQRVSYLLWFIYQMNATDGKRSNNSKVLVSSILQDVYTDCAVH